MDIPCAPPGRERERDRRHKSPVGIISMVIHDVKTKADAEAQQPLAWELKPCRPSLRSQAVHIGFEDTTNTQNNCLVNEDVLHSWELSIRNLKWSLIFPGHVVFIQV